MKRYLLLALMLFSPCAHGASVSTLNGTATNLTISGVSGGLSIFSANLTNGSYVVNSPDTKNIYVTGAGTAGANGQYVYQKTRSTGGVWTNTVGTFFITKDTSGLADWPFILDTTTNNTGGLELYGNPGTRIGTWVVNTGVGPAPTAVWGTNTQTRTGSYMAESVPGGGSILHATSVDSIYAALGNAVSGDLIVVSPGTYNVNNLLKDGVNWRFLPGAKVVSTNFGVSDLKSSDTGWGVFDDRSSPGPVRCVIDFDSLQLASNADGPNSVTGILVVTNAGSYIVMNGNIMDASLSGGSGYRASIVVSNSLNVVVHIAEIRDTYPAVNFIDDFADSNFGKVIPVAGSSIGVMWFEGELYVHCDLMVITNNYSIWPGHDGIFTKESNFWYVGNYLRGWIYGDAHSTNSRAWMIVNEVDGLNLPVASLAAVGLYGGTGNGAGGRYYFSGQKVSHSKTCLTVAIGATAWVTCQKFTSPRQWISMNSGDNLSPTICFADVLQLEDSANSVGTTAGFPGIDNTGGAQTNTTLYLRGQLAACKGEFLLQQANNGTTIEGFKINTSSGTNSPIRVTGIGLTLKNCVLVAPTTTNSITATGAQTVGIYTDSGANRTVNANITLSPNAGLTVDSNYK